MYSLLDELLLRETVFHLRFCLGRISKVSVCKKTELAYVLILLCANFALF